MNGAVSDQECALDTGARLDAHHRPETNGRMAICRCCGARTDSPAGLRHVPDPGQQERSERWLEAKTQSSRIGRVRNGLGT